MKMKSYIYPLAISLVISAASCSREEENIWEDSAAVRTEKVVKEQFETLCGAPNGWSMYYFAAESENGGVNFSLNFNENGSVVIGTKNIYNSPVFAEETSLWEIITDNGPVLTFNSYNNLFHFFSDPDDGIAGGSKGVGLGGDYEFMIMSYCPDSVVLKGKKTGVYCKMFPIETGITSEEYFTKLDEFQATLINSYFNYIWLNAENGERYSARFIPGSRTVDFVIEGGDPLFDTHTIPYVATNTGVRLFEPFEGDNEDLNIQDFVYDSQTKLLVCANDGKSYLSAGNINAFLTNPKQVWQITENGGGKLGEAYQAIVDKCKEINYSLTAINFSWSKEFKAITLNFTLKSGRLTYVGNFPGEFLANDNGLNINLEKEGDSNANTLSVAVPQLISLVEALNEASPLEATSDSPLCPSVVKIQSKADPNSYLVLEISKPDQDWFK